MSLLQKASRLATSFTGIRKYPKLTTATVVVVVGSVLSAAAIVSVAQADYTPPAFVYPNVGAGGAKVQNQNTPLNPTDSVAAWNAWTSRSKLSVGADGCGVTTACIIYADEGATLFYTSCVLPFITSGYAARAYFIAHPNDPGGHAGTNIPFGEYCEGLAVNYNIFVIVYNSSANIESWFNFFVQRHEVGHAIGLGDATSLDTSCWQEWGFWLPVMKNNASNCTAYGYNYTASYNEAVAAVIRSGW